MRWDVWLLQTASLPTSATNLRLNATVRVVLDHTRKMNVIQMSRSRMAKNRGVAYVEIETAVLVCPCGHRTEVPPREGLGLLGQPHQRCAGCGKKWWAPGVADCSEDTE
jgi:hypothetical protein